MFETEEKWVTSFTGMQAIKVLNTVYRRAPTNVVDYVDFLDFHKICFTKNKLKFYRDMDR